MIIKKNKKFNSNEMQKNNYNLLLKMGLKYSNEKNFSKAKEIFSELITLDEKRYEAFLNLSNIFILKKKFSNSEEILKKFLKINSYNKNIILALANLYYNIKDYKKLDILLEKYINLEEDYLLYYFKSIIYEQNNNPDKQKIYLQKTINLNKKFWQAYEKLLNLFEKINRMDEFYKLITSTQKIFIKNLKVNYYFALYLYRKNKFDLALKKLKFKETETEFIGLSNNTYLVNLYDLVSKIYLNQKKYKLSLDYSIKRNFISINSEINKKYNKEIIIDTISKYKTYFKSYSKNYDKRESMGLYHDNLSFLVGFPRSGTTLIDSILRSHSQTIVLEEKPYLINIRHKFFKKNTLENIEKITENEIIKLQKLYFDSFDYSKKKIIIDKFPLNIIELGFIKKIFPNCKIILALRHPLDAILSCVLTSFKINEAMANYENLNTSAFFYNKVFSLFNIYKNSLKLHHHEIKYENIILNFDLEINLLLKFLNLKNEGSLKNFHVTAKNREKINTPSYHQVIKPIYNKSINRYKKFTDVESIRPIVNEWIKEFDY